MPYYMMLFESNKDKSKYKFVSYIILKRTKKESQDLVEFINIVLPNHLFIKNIWDLYSLKKNLNTDEGIDVFDFLDNYKNTKFPYIHYTFINFSLNWYSLNKYIEYIGVDKFLKMKRVGIMGDELKKALNY